MKLSLFLFSVVVVTAIGLVQLQKLSATLKKLPPNSVRTTSVPKLPFRNVPTTRPTSTTRKLSTKPTSTTKFPPVTRPMLITAKRRKDVTKKARMDPDYGKNRYKPMIY
ncbi:uncharacterized protein LOC112566506 [Pomacea canaliculata]|uniref:uncharacterized protein LOC112566506 n=1 Tax=Pomacea canaliculata TaxID=400727 RepID=UPI000D73EAF9|nr:uncharacterized protein LOC112566506 [Pomacea canaliculata]